MKIIYLILLGLSCSFQALTQGAPINNLVHTSGYKAGQYGAIPQYIKSGEGKQVMILIPGAGFDASVFKDFMTANRKNYTMYAITIPGYGNTAAPNMPDTGTSYGDQTWSKSALAGIDNLIQKEKLKSFVVAGHFVLGVQLAVATAANHPDKAKGVIILGGPGKFIVSMNGQTHDLSADQLAKSTDQYTAPKWFKEMKQKFFDDNNFLPEMYSLDSVVAKKLWEQVASVPLPVAIRYYCEYFASDARAELSKVKCPVLVLRATFNRKVLSKPVNNYIEPQFIASWDKAKGQVEIVDIHDAATFVWKDNPVEVNAAIKQFMMKL